MPTTRTVVLVGHCGPDAFMLKSAVGRAVPEASIIMVNDARTLKDYLDETAVLLVNRVLDGRFVSTNGVDLIRDVTGRENPPVTMLISNYDDAQRDAVEAGATPGFGKSDLYDAATTESLKRAATLA